MMTQSVSFLKDIQNFKVVFASELIHEYVYAFLQQTKTRQNIFSKFLENLLLSAFVQINSRSLHSQTLTK